MEEEFSHKLDSMLWRLGLLTEDSTVVFFQKHPRDDNGKREATYQEGTK